MLNPPVKVCSRPQISLKYICLPSERPCTTASSSLKIGFIRQVVASTPHSCNQPRVGLFRSVSRFCRARLPLSPPPPVDIVCAMRTLVACGDPHCATLWRRCPRQSTPRRTRWLTALRLPASRLSGVVGLQPTRGSAYGG